MRIIKSIEIKHFRSFDGSVHRPKIEIYSLKDLNIFSGANDSGKSNVLRALNLFFNDEISPGIPFKLERDLCKIQKERSDIRAQKKRLEKGRARQRDLWVKIRVYFVNEKDGILPKEFYVEKTWDHNGLQPTKKTNIEKKNEGLKLTKRQKSAQMGRLTQFLNSIAFEYIPAIKDRKYFNMLFSKLQNALFQRKGDPNNNFKKASDSFNSILKNQTNNLFTEFRRKTTIDASFNVPETLVDFVNTLSVKTEHDISLFDRGDGIQARFIPIILEEIYRLSKKKVIWGFEEPENSYEDRNIRKLRDDFLTKYSSSKQIFVTTHSFNILSMEGENISTYRVWKDEDKTSIISPPISEIKQRNFLIKSAGELLNEELGIFEYSTAIEKAYREVEEKRKSLSDKLEQIKSLQKALVFVEGRTDEMYFNKAKELFSSSQIPYSFHWIGHIDEGGKEAFTGKDSLNKLLQFLKSSPDFMKQHKCILLFDSDAGKKTEKISPLLYVVGVSKNDLNTRFIRGSENLLSLEETFDYKPFYLEHKKITAYGEENRQQEFKKMEFAKYLCNHCSEEEQRKIFSNFQDIITKIENYLT